MKSDDKGILLEENTPVRDAINILMLQAKSFEQPGESHGRLCIMFSSRIIPLTFFRFKSIRTEKRKSDQMLNKSSVKTVDSTELSKSSQHLCETLYFMPNMCSTFQSQFSAIKKVLCGQRAGD